MEILEMSRSQYFKNRMDFKETSSKEKKIKFWEISEKLILWFLLFKGFLGGSVGKESACNTGGMGLTPGSWRYPGERNGNQCQYSCLGNPTDKSYGLAGSMGLQKSQMQFN